MSVLVDTSVWVDYFRRVNGGLSDLLARDVVITHPMVIGEIACGTPPSRHLTLVHLARLRSCNQATLREVMDFLDREALYGLGCGLADIALLASTLLTTGTTVWTLDRRLAGLAERFGVRYVPA